jgi:hypothetical protein
MSNCVTCGDELPPERAEKYDYCTKPKCQKLNAKGLRMVAVGVNKAADQYVVLDERTKREMASGRFKKRPEAGGSVPIPTGPIRTPVKAPVARPAVAALRPWSEAQENLALIYRRMGMRPN